MIATLFLLILVPLGYWWLIRLRWNDFPPAGVVFLSGYGPAFLLPLILPYRLLEKALYDRIAGLGNVWLISVLITVLELSLLAFLIDRLYRRLKPQHATALFPFWLFIGIGFALGKITRDLLLILFHDLSRFYGYSQFSTFPTGPFLIQRLLEIVFGVAACAFLAFGRYRDVPYPIRRFVGFVLLSFFILQMEIVPRLLFQFIPFLSLFTQAYLVSLLPLLCILTLGILWYAYRREERREALSRETERLTSA
ncbi:MAG TPA: hypothetical protein VLH40_01130 [Atribacteraceae bacterium]|nr:hypothetical protein [Atribacteraceae bacterium]